MRLLRRIVEVDSLLRPRCGGQLAVVAVLTDPKVVDRILRHVLECTLEADRTATRLALYRYLEIRRIVAAWYL